MLKILQDNSNFYLIFNTDALPLRERSAPKATGEGWSKFNLSTPHPRQLRWLDFSRKGRSENILNNTKILNYAKIFLTLSSPFFLESSTWIKKFFLLYLQGCSVPPLQMLRWPIPFLMMLCPIYPL